MKEKNRNGGMNMEKSEGRHNLIPYALETVAQKS